MFMRGHMDLVAPMDGFTHVVVSVRNHSIDLELCLGIDDEYKSSGSCTKMPRRNTIRFQALERETWREVARDIQARNKSVGTVGITLF